MNGTVPKSKNTIMPQFFSGKKKTHNLFPSSKISSALKACSSSDIRKSLGTKILPTYLDELSSSQTYLKYIGLNICSIDLKIRKGEISIGSTSQCEEQEFHAGLSFRRQHRAKYPSCSTAFPGTVKGSLQWNGQIPKTILTWDIIFAKFYYKHLSMSVLLLKIISFLTIHKILL